MQKFVIDTNVLVENPNVINELSGDAVIPFETLVELDRLKKKPELVGRQARVACKTLFDLCENADLSSWIQLENGFRLLIAPRDMSSGASGDEAILATISKLKMSSPDDEFVLVTNDINMRVRAFTACIKTTNFLKSSVASENLYGGVTRFTVEKDDIDRLYESGALPSDVIKCELFPNQFCVLSAPQKSTAKTLIARYMKSQSQLRLIRDVGHVFGLKSRNKEQTMALNLLLDRDVQLVTLTGAGGVGKSLISFAAGVQQVLEDKFYEKLIVIKPIHPVGRDVGYLPGTLQEKMDPWMSPVLDALEFLFNSKPRKTIRGGKKESSAYMSLLLENGTIEIDALSFIRGRSIPNAFIVVDEAQNLDAHEVKTIITRAAEGTKIVFCGDIFQADRTDVNIYTNGLTKVIEAFKDQEIAGHVALIKGERGVLSSLAAQIL